MKFAKRVGVLNALARKQNRNKTPELSQALIPSPPTMVSPVTLDEPGPSLYTRPIPFHLLQDNTPLSLLQHSFLPFLVKYSH